ncbi:MAG: ADP-ribosylglycohydrolase family protein [Anaerolineae bacterium]|nr:ADP-ribosylglycohydrolase family protein [Anaerolineae bacterium]
MESISKKQRYRGALLGLACGDAVGTTLEFKPPGTFEPIDDMVGGGPFNLEPGQWTDDTSMALCLAESLLEKRGFDPTDQIERYVRWYHRGYMSSTGECFDIGNTVRSALHHFEKTGEPYSGSTHPQSAGNGSIMRLAPVSLAYAPDPRHAIELSADSSKTTHQAPLAVDGCRYLAALLIGAVNGVEKSELLAERYSPIAGYWQENPLAPEIDAVAAGSFKTKMPPLSPNPIVGKLGFSATNESHIKGTGYVVDSLEAALWAFYRSQSFEEGCLLAANLGDDADTTAAVYGQLAGAFYGEEGIPSKWRTLLTMRALIEDVADRLYAFGR